MPEGPEVETEKLHEAIQEELEHDGGAFLRRIALTTALLAAIAAVAALHAGSTVNEALVLKAEANILQTRASDQWAYYQAKGIKAAVQEASRSAWLAAGKDAPPSFEQTKGRYAAEQGEIKAKAEELERDRDEKSHEADHLLHRHHRFASSVALFQVSIALGALAALTRNKLLWLGSLLLGGGGLAVAALALFG